MTRCLLARTLLAAVLFVPAGAGAHAQTSASQQPGAAGAEPSAPGAAAPEASRYSALVERLKAGDFSVDLGDLREAYTETPGYRATMMAVYQQLWRPLNAGDFPTALKTAETVLEGNYVEINAHMVAFFALAQLGNVPRSQFHRRIADGLLKVVMSKGDGKSPETAYEVIDISEEYAVMRALNLTMKAQGLSGAPGQARIDTLTVIDNRTKEERALYFNVDRSFAAMSRTSEQKK